MSAPEIVVLDYGSGNVRSAVRALEAAGASVELTADPVRAEAAQGLVVPGVGAFSAVMDGLRGVGAVELIRRRHAQQRPLLGICVGLQVLFSSGTEHGLTDAGVGLWPGEVTRLRAPIVPHMGWDTVAAPAGSQMFAGIEDERFYFVHSFAAHTPPPGAPAALTRAGEDFVAAVEDGTTWAVQFHPEKSADAGLHLLRNWLEALSRMGA
ncbi:imidazole glycerol phosphate synthase subunit HisH [Brevibacterium sp. BRM-1]|uniref:imidazole glycerol phosphate synthase subunit HisH n=1 Tax=Brevibacterium sp. BRM-1 TaxID=2999062 RepID=UPI0022803ECC|nr:imidazole glycerol phosphate synthase subunit HisH [Brevibacterium sp. BRM-1]WAL41204.1 imidazole glycerol phosphate synthase subunit HisH [Brevibacterium sp. BRM-1]